jgi:hypothetical protein
MRGRMGVGGDGFGIGGFRIVFLGAFMECRLVHMGA